LLQRHWKDAEKYRLLKIMKMKQTGDYHKEIESPATSIEDCSFPLHILEIPSPGSGAEGENRGGEERSDRGGYSGGIGGEAPVVSRLI